MFPQRQEAVRDWFTSHKNQSLSFLYIFVERAEEEEEVSGNCTVI